MEGVAAQRKGIGCDGDTLKIPVVDGGTVLIGGTVSKPPLPSPLEKKSRSRRTDSTNTNESVERGPARILTVCVGTRA